MERKLTNKIPLLRSKNGYHKHSKRDNSFNLTGNQRIFKDTNKRKKSNKKSKNFLILGLHQNMSNQGSGHHGSNYSGSMTNHKDIPSYLDQNHKFIKRKSGNSGSKDKPLKLSLIHI